MTMPETGTQHAVLCHRRDAYGEIIVTDQGDTRTLCFGNGVLQSIIRINRPDILTEDFHQAMMSALLFVRCPRSVLLIGLGGGSLVHCLFQAFPECVIDVVEIRQQVIDVAREYFLLPTHDARLRVFHAAGSDFIADRSGGQPMYDIILVDAFDEAGPAASLLEKDFLSACRKRLNKGGVFGMNLWNSPAHNFGAYYDAIRDAFGGHTLKLLLSESYRNAVAFGFEDPAACRRLPEHRTRAADLQKRYGTKFTRFLRYLYWQNFNDQDQ